MTSKQLPFVKEEIKMKAEKTPLRYIVQRIMRTIFTQARQEEVATDIYVGYKRQQPYFLIRCRQEGVQRRTCYHSRPPLLTAR